jgi:hypothetical protein
MDPAKEPTSDVAATGPVKSAVAASRPSADWVRVWLTGLAFFYPAYWLSRFILLALPALVRVALFGDRLEDLQLLPGGAFASSSPRAPITGAYHGTRSPFSLGILAVLALATVVTLALTGRRRRTISGLMLAVLGNLLLIPWLIDLLFLKRNIAPNLLGCSLFFGVLCLGLRWMLDAWFAAGYWRRFGSALVGFVLPLGASWVGFREFGAVFRPILLVLIAPGVVAALMVSLRPASVEPQRSGWKTVGWGLAATLLLAAGLVSLGRAVNRAFARARSAKARAELASIPEVPPNTPYPKLFFQRGVNFTAEWPDRYESEGARRMLRQLPSYGINAIALVPYGWSSSNPPRVRIGGGPNSWESDEGVEELARRAHSLGMKVMLKPAIWDSYKLELPSAQDRAAWFDQYRLFLEHHARLAAKIHADVFFVGGEFNHLSQYDAEWRNLIGRARAIYPGPLVYGANFGQEFESIRFWDALDDIGLQEYYPLPDNLSTEALVEKVEAVQKKYGKLVIFTEAGFPASQAANRRPWEDGKGGKVAPADQARCYEAILRAFYNQPWFSGVYWWKVGTDGDGGPEDGSLTPWGKPAMGVVKRWYLDGGR